MKKKIFLICALIYSACSCAAFAYGALICPRCGFEGIWTGEWTQDAWGIHNIYECPNGHRFTDGTASPNSEDPNVISCPQCGLMSMWTGEWTQDAWGIHNIYECPNGHRFTLD